MNDHICFEYFFEISIERREPMVRCAAFSHQQAHRITLIAKGRRQAIEDESYPELIAIGNLQTIPTLQPACDALTAIIDRGGFHPAFGNTAEYKRLGCPVNLGNSYLHSALHRIKSGW